MNTWKQGRQRALKLIGVVLCLVIALPLAAASARDVGTARPSDSSVSRRTEPPLRNAAAEFNAQDESRRTPREILNSMGKHFKGKCKEAARRFRQRFPAIDRIITGRTDGIASVDDVEELKRIGKRKGDKLLRQAVAYSHTFNVPLTEAFDIVTRNRRELMIGVEDRRMGAFFVTEDLEPTLSYRSMETAWRHDDPDQRTSLEDTIAYDRQPHCTRGS